jgi:D-alanyl-D-alanine carboxypeptidase/D-alanyl-D-alanine-endopeptidase (penicillin-binding protein 4)
VVLVGGGDPTLVTSIARAIGRVPPDQPTTLLDALARRLREQGVRRIEGRVLGDESLFDALRTVPTWPARFVAQGQSGPLSGLAVDDGYWLEPTEDGRWRRVRSQDPPLDAARALRAILEARGIEVTGDVGAGVAPGDARALVAIESPPLHTVVADLLRRSDNQAAELVLKHLGVAGSGEGSTAAGARAVAAWSAEVGADAPGSFVADGSGLDPTNLVTCRQLVEVLARSGPDRALAEGLPVAGRSGTLAGRFRATAAQDRLRAKTGRLNGVSALAGFVDLRDGSTATFAYVANASVITAQQLRAQDFLAEILGRYEVDCPAAASPDVAVPLAPSAAALVRVGVLSGAGGAGALAPTLAAIDAATDPASPWLDRCSRAGGAGVSANGAW